MSNSDLSDVLAKIPYGVSVVTTGRGGVVNGLTISWMSQVSFDPPMLMVSVDKLHYSVDLFRSTKNFCVNLLAETQLAVAGHFAKQATTGEDKLATVPHRESDSGASILTEAVAYFDCELVQLVEAGDHFLAIGKVESAGILNDVEPLRSSSGMRYRKR